MYSGKSLLPPVLQSLLIGFSPPERTPCSLSPSNNVCVVNSHIMSIARSLVNGMARLCHLLGANLTDCESISIIQPVLFSKKSKISLIRTVFS